MLYFVLSSAVHLHIKGMRNIYFCILFGKISDKEKQTKQSVKCCNLFGGVYIHVKKSQRINYKNVLTNAYLQEGWNSMVKWT